MLLIATNSFLKLNFLVKFTFFINFPAAKFKISNVDCNKRNLFQGIKVRIGQETKKDNKNTKKLLIQHFHKNIFTHHKKNLNMILKNNYILWEKNFPNFFLLLLKTQKTSGKKKQTNFHS